jgi:hypothetical protein
MASQNKALTDRISDTATGKRVLAVFEQIQSVAEDSSFRRNVSAVPESVSLTFGALQSVAYEALSEKVPDVRWRRIVVFALARFIIMGMSEAGPSRQELNSSRQDALRAKILIDRLAFGPYVGPRQKARLKAIGNLLIGVSDNLKVRVQAESHVRSLDRELVAPQFLEDLAEGFQTTVGKCPTLTDRSFGTPFVDLATMAAAAARDFASRLDPNLADRLPQPTHVRTLLRNFLDNKRHRAKPLIFSPAPWPIHQTGRNKHSPG